MRFLRGFPPSVSTGQRKKENQGGKEGMPTACIPQRTCVNNTKAERALPNVLLTQASEESSGAGLGLRN